MTEPITIRGVTVHRGDCIEVMRTLAPGTVDAVVTDPPYGLAFMGKAWDHNVPGPVYWRECLRLLKPGGYLLAAGGARTYHRLAVAVEDAGFVIRDQIMWLYGQGFPKGRSQLKPAHEPIVMARKPAKGSGAGALNIDACRIAYASEADRLEALPGSMNHAHAGFGSSFAIKDRRHILPADAQNARGRWPANVIHDGSDEVMEAFAAFGELRARGNVTPTKRSTNFWGGESRYSGPTFGGDTGTASRFFYCAKANRNERCGSKHPTIKPLALMRYLCRLVTPPGGVVLDPFAGTGTTGEAAALEGMRAVLIENEPEYVADIVKRLGRDRQQQLLTG
jgi:DNA modification methylase